MIIYLQDDDGWIKNCVCVKCAVMMMGIALFLFAHTHEAVEMDDVSPIAD